MLANDAKKALMMLTRYAAVLMGSKIKSFPVIQYNGYPVGWAMVNLDAQLMKSPESSEVIVGAKVII